MTLRLAAALVVLTAGFGTAAQAAPSCEVTVMGLTFNNCTTEAPAVIANLGDRTNAWSSQTVRADVAATGAVGHRQIAR